MVVRFRAASFAAPFDWGCRIWRHFPTRSFHVSRRTSEPCFRIAQPTRACSSSEEFSILQERPLFSRYQRVSERVVRYPNGKRVSYDVLGREQGQSVFIFPLSPCGESVTLLREYAPGPHRVMYGFPAGYVETKGIVADENEDILFGKGNDGSGSKEAKHSSVEDAARAELSEEARLICKELVPLNGESGIISGKYSQSAYFYFLGLGCTPDPSPGPRDHAEWIEIIPDFPLCDVERLIREGFMNTPNCLLASMALRYLDVR